MNRGTNSHAGTESVCANVICLLAASLIGLTTSASPYYQITPLQNLGTNSSGNGGYGFGVNSAGTAVGQVGKYSGGTSLGPRAVRWSFNGSVTELGNLGTDSSGMTFSYAYCISDNGLTCGYSDVYSGNTSLGDRAVLWAAGQTAPTLLGDTGENSNGYTSAIAYAVNASGAAAGAATEWAAGQDMGYRPVRWDAGHTNATELGVLGVSNGGTSFGKAFGIDTTGNVYGFSQTYSGGVDMGYRAVRWNAGSSVPNQLADLGHNSAGYTDARPRGSNAAGDAVGYATTWAGNTNLGVRAVRWAAGQGGVVKLDDLGTTSSGFGNSQANAINSLGDTVGYSNVYSGDTSLGFHATLWFAHQTTVIDLNTLIDPASGWVLNSAYGINDSGVIVGQGTYDPDGSGPIAPQVLPFRLDINTNTPEPTVCALAFSAVMLALKRRR